MEILEIAITGLGHEGEGVGRAEGKAVFVPGALPGERVRVKIIENKRNYLRGLLAEVLERCPQRLDAPCNVFEDCGGCQLQHLDYQASLEWKSRRVAESLQRIGKLDGVTVKEAIGMDMPWRYRNKVQLQVGEDKGRLALGYFSHKTRRLVRFTDCLLLPTFCNELRDFIEEWLNAKDVKPGSLQQVVIRHSPVTGEAMVGFVGTLPELQWQELTTEFPEVKSIVAAEKTGVTVLAGEGTIKDRIYGNDFNLSFESFVQINHQQTTVLYQKAMEYAALTGAENVLDAYCGIGTITLALARSARHAVGVEIVEQAIRDARINAMQNKVQNVQFYTAPAEHILPRLAGRGVNTQVVVVDPPRKGCEAEVLEAIAELGPQRIVYVSCDPATLARDLGRLNQLGYVTKEAQPIDMFPWTSHVETVILLQKKHI